MVARLPLARLPLACLLGVAAPSSAQRADVLVQRGEWIALDRGAHCSAETAALRPAVRGREPARLAVQFAPGRAAVSLRLSRPASGAAMLIIAGRPFAVTVRGDVASSSDARQTAAMVEALRAGGWASIRARGAAGRVIDHYRLDGAPLAIDAAAACAAARAQREGFAKRDDLI